MTIRENMLDEGLTIYKDDEIVAMVQAPYMNDASGEAYSEAVTSTLEVVDETAGIYCVTVSAEEEYFNSETLNYPVTVASDFTWQDNSKIADQYVLSDYPGFNYYDAGITSFYVGKGAQGVSRAYFTFGDLSSFSKDYIKRAELVLTECSNSLAGKTVHAYRITSDWDQTELCWNNQPAFDGTAVGQLTTKGVVLCQEKVQVKSEHSIYSFILCAQ